MSEIKKSLHKPFLHKKSIMNIYEKPVTSHRFIQKDALYNNNNQFLNLNLHNSKRRQVYYGPIKPINSQIINYPHYGYVGEQYVFGNIPNFKKREYQKPYDYLLK